ncbi:hypothetical protein [Candidatus Methylacidithermus pantelleriae]|uniref:Uncharacterized protein n=1 Tax=Candidatus Methylacidithermus pantelleriae TaxID=2744239 RepID=A0A8J2BML0_9BACT|nr:hypothetical protein [Candidatus Methylacidithermus pantelleriae]CAF0699208.1 hypothetical protein MPNT_30160 [Candidatus Methylacidithermus pantelleriae]
MPSALVRSVPSPKPKGSRWLKAGFSPDVDVIEVDPDYTSVTGAVNHAPRHSKSFHYDLVPLTGQHGVFPNGDPCQRQSCLLPVAVK